MYHTINVPILKFIIPFIIREIVETGIGTYFQNTLETVNNNKNKM